MDLLRDAPLKALERVANADPASSSKQLAFVQNLGQRYPEALIRRYEQPGYNYCEDAHREYLRACHETGHQPKSSLSPVGVGRSALGGAGPLHAESVEAGAAAAEHLHRPTAGPHGPYGGHQQYLGARPGTTPAKPLHVAQSVVPVHWTSHAWTTGRYIAVSLIVVTALGALLDEKGLGGRGGLGGGKDTVQQATDSDKRFPDVLGCDEAKQELEEIVDYLRNPSKFTRLGGTLPRGVLLTGPPGTGKTLLAKAVAGEAGVPFFYASGSGFEEVYVGVGARRVRDLFQEAKKKAPCIIFIDEIDAIGGSRSLKDQSAMKMTLNEMLVQMDGFSPNSGVIVLGATNFKQSLDAALTRPGRFDKMVNVPLPDVQGRKEIIERYSKDTKFAPDVDISVLARGTPGFSGAELYNLINQAAVKASIEDLPAINHSVLEWAKDKILMGAERKSAIITAETAKCTAFHEAGHALVCILNPAANPIHKATIMPRGRSLGLVAQLPEGDQTSQSYKQMLAWIDVCMGGRVAEELVFGAENITSGASSDLQQATRMARAMVTKYGFSKEVGYVFHAGEAGEEQSSEKTRILIDQEVKAILDASYARVTALVKENKAAHTRLANALLEWETLTGAECVAIVKENKKPKREKVNTRGGAKGDTEILAKGKGLGGGVGVHAAKGS